jgi:NAD(P)-dependent dehydrogenase (short-subunit alcohol dehydrogenase family)
VIVVDVDGQAAEDAVAMIHGAGGEALPRADISRPATVELAVARTIETYGRVDILHFEVALFWLHTSSELADDVCSQNRGAYVRRAIRASR